MNLIHVTQLENLESILQNGFQYSQCREIFISTNIEKSEERRADFFFPMISFFGMTLDEHLRFNQTYGNLGIVFNDNIMKLIELNPVRYVSRYSIVAKRISEFEEFKSHLTMSDKGIQLHGIGGISDVQFKSFLTSEGIGFKYNTVRTWMENLAYSKSFVAELERKDKSTGKYQVSAPYYYFGLEREWRIVPIQLFVNFDKTKERLTDVDFFKIYENINLNPYFEKIIVKSGFRGQVEELLYKFKLNHVEIILNDSYGNDS